MWCYAAARSFGASISCYIMPRCRTFSYTSPHTSCIAAVRSLAFPYPRMRRRCAYFALLYTHHATVPRVLLHLCRTLARTSPHTSCYAAARPLALPHIRHATLPHVHLHFSTYVMFLCCMFVCFVSWYHARQDLATCPCLAMALGKLNEPQFEPTHCCQLRAGQVGKKQIVRR